jgi:hypothetical protein
MDATLTVDRLDLGSMLKDLNITNALEGSLMPTYESMAAANR